MITMEELLASQSKKLITFHRGQEVEGEVVAITEKELTLDIGGKSEGIIAAREIPSSQLTALKVGSKLKAYIYLQENEHGQIVLSLSPQTRASTTSFKGRGINWFRFLQAQNQKNKLQGKVIEVNKGGLIVEVGGARGFLPNSQVGFELMSKAGQGMENLIGQDLTVIVIEIDEDNNKLIFSQRGQVSEETLKKLREFKANQKVKGKIVAILPFGLVVDVSGVEGLVFISDVSWERQEDLTKTFTTGQELEVLVLGLDEELGRLNLSIKQLIEDPFAKIAEKFPADEIVKAIVTTVSDTGVIFQLDEGIEGFLPNSKITDTYEIGQAVTLLIDSVDIQRRRVNLAPFVTSTAGLIYK